MSKKVGAYLGEIYGNLELIGHRTRPANSPRQYYHTLKCLDCGAETERQDSSLARVRKRCENEDFIACLICRDVEYKRRKGVRQERKAHEIEQRRIKNEWLKKARHAVQYYIPKLEDIHLSPGTEVGGVVVVPYRKAKEEELKKFFTGIPCENGHISERGTTHKQCLECCKDRYQDNRESKLETQKAWRLRNPDYIKEKSTTWYAVPENREKSLRCATQWQKDNRDRVNMRNRSRRKLIELATPPWAGEAFWTSIQNIYKEARVLGETTGIPHHVDHVVPVQHELVCGLHVPWNLRAIPAIENLSKSNFFDVS
jgi:hypothetical protein